MYSDKVAILHLGAIPNVNFYEMTEERGWVDLSPNTLIEDIGIEVPQFPGVLSNPDWVIPGEWKIINNNQIQEFYCTTQGTYNLYITGVDKGSDNTLRLMPNLKYKGYWEDNKRGYLFQIIKNS